MTKTNNKENRDANFPTELGDLKKLLQENFQNLDERMQAVENGVCDMSQMSNALYR